GEGTPMFEIANLQLSEGGDIALMQLNLLGQGSKHTSREDKLNSKCMPNGSTVWSRLAAINKAQTKNPPANSLSCWLTARVTIIFARQRRCSGGGEATAEG